MKMQKNINYVTRIVVNSSEFKLCVVLMAQSILQTTHWTVDFSFKINQLPKPLHNTWNKLNWSSGVRK